MIVSFLNQRAHCLCVVWNKSRFWCRSEQYLFQKQILIIVKLWQMRVLFEFFVVFRCVVLVDGASQVCLTLRVETSGEHHSTISHDSQSHWPSHSPGKHWICRLLHAYLYYLSDSYQCWAVTLSLVLVYTLFHTGGSTCLESTESLQCSVSFAHIFMDYDL